MSLICFICIFVKSPVKLEHLTTHHRLKKIKTTERGIHLTLTINNLMNLFANKILKENVYRKNYS